MMAPEDHPQAQVEEVRPRRWGGLFPLMALLLALYLGGQAWYQQGPRVTIHVSEGHALGVGDPLKYRGVTLGVVEEMKLAADLDSVTVVVRMDSSAEGICRQGSRFWLVHPEIGLDRFEGLETVIGAHYITVDPGDPEGPYQFEFNALQSAPALEKQDTGGLQIRLLARQRGGLAAGAQVTYRGEQVGSVLGTRLTSDATGVEIDLHIWRDYVDLVRTDSQFWKTGGFEMNLALMRGLSVELDSLRSLVVGGIAFATPNNPSETAMDGHRYDLHDQAKEEWEEWRPSLTIGTSNEPPVEESPHLRATLTYESGRLISRKKTREGWVVALPGAVLGSVELLQVPESAEEGSAELTIGGGVVDLSQASLWQGRGLLLREAKVPNAHPLRLDDLVLEAGPQDCQIRSIEGGRPLSISRTRLAAADGGWQVDEAINLDDFESGSLVWGEAAERYVGLLMKSEEMNSIIPFDSNLW